MNSVLTDVCIFKEKIQILCEISQFLNVISE